MPKQLNILMLEDSPFDSELVQRLLNREIPEATIRFAANKAGFLAALEEQVPDIILSDNSLPDIDAKGALVVSRQKYPYMPFIMVSGTVGEEFASEIIRLGADDYILKDRLVRLPASIDTAIIIRQREKEKEEALNLLRFNEEKYRTLVERITDAFISVDHNFIYTYLNEKAGELIRRDPRDLIGKNVWDIFPEAVGSVTYYSFQKAMQEQKYVFSVDYFEPLDLWQENHIYPSPDGLSIFIRDITQQKKAQEAVKRMELKVTEQRIESQKKITRAIIVSQENERNRLGKEMHDNINQILTASKIYLTRGKKDVPEDIRYPLQLIDKAIEEIRLLSRRYVTPLKDVDLKELLGELISELRENHIDADLAYDMGEQQPEDDLKLNIYRMAQVQVNNILKYASAKHVTLILEAKPREIQIVISDDGVGFDISARRKGIGLSNMINRVETFNGTIDISSSPGNGCTVQIFLPLQAQ
ncbi:hybrid sensor histidine kinase/response regulator [Sediminibacterium soli]|uniref:hybrid sensor histidine kinase/response regulator n=1 Tax=Sediminibacterium soli TaxID=2698829 RepID=UPI00137B2AEF|nr:response regulator [Sediminibacterium soli]NCI47978.1 response regulator [Sediminibacterium soli]